MRSYNRMFVGILLAGAALAGSPAAGGLKIGVGRTVITPPLDVPMAGYYYPRSADGVHDDLHASTLLFDDGRTRVALVACELVHVTREAVEAAREKIHAKWGIPASHVLISATHSHTGPIVSSPEYMRMLGTWIADSVTTAEGRKCPARLFTAVEKEASIAHYRRYLMKDGSVRTNPWIVPNAPPDFVNPDVVRPIGATDPDVGVLYAEDDSRAPLVTWVNYAMHQDTVGGTWISADYAYYLGRFLSNFKGPDMPTVFTIGAAGNINHYDIRRPGPQRGPETARRFGEVLGSAVTKAYTHMEGVSNPEVRAISETISLPLAKITAQEVEESRKLLAQPPPPNLDFTIERVQAAKVLAVHKRNGQPVRAEIQVIAVGPVAFVGIPGELFVELGQRIKKTSPFRYTFIVELANDSIGYIPTREAYAEGSYEPTSTSLAAGAGEQIADTAARLLKRLAQP
ncbi:MAG TPA: hypothetical protein VN442_14165 [Bryobacteraceae bacterium]|nr:hypothetical protein [Bryobacteraceae bacterium]